MSAQGRLLRVDGKNFVAGAVWAKIGGIWSCIHAAPILRWMVGMDSDRAKRELRKRGARFQWL